MRIFVGFELSISLSLVFYKKMTNSKIKFDEICVNSLVGPRSSSNQGNPMVQERARLKEFGLGAEMIWDAR